MCEPLRGKRKELNKHLETIDDNDGDLFDFDDVKSAVEGLIKYHEDEIERIIETPHYTTAMNAWAMAQIRVHYRELQLIQHWFWDVIE